MVCEIHCPVSNLPRNTLTDQITRDGNIYSYKCKWNVPPEVGIFITYVYRKDICRASWEIIPYLATYPARKG